ncbi:MAG: dihydroneopterin aldolase [Alphaproteobacteria bacterium]
MSKAMVFPIKPAPRSASSDHRAGGASRIIVRDLRLDCPIGVKREEKGRLQPVIFNLDIEVDSPAGPAGDVLGQVLDYDIVVDAVRAITGEGHTELVETLAERIAAFCLSQDRVLRVTVQVEKPDAIAEAASVGVAITRLRQH